MLGRWARSFENARGALVRRLEQKLAAQFKPTARDPADVDGVREGNALLAAGNAAGALRFYEDACRSSPDRHEAWLNRGFVLLELGHQSEAQACLNQALELYPQNADAWYLLGGICERQDRWPDAVDAYRRSIALRPAFAEAYRDLGRLYHLRGDRELAKSTVVEGLARVPDAADLHVYLGNVWLEEQDPGAAEASFDWALRLQPEHAAASLNLASIRAKQGRTEDVELLCARALHAEPGSAPFFVQAAEIYLAMGQRHQSLKHYQRALAIEPAYAPAHAGVALILMEQGRLSEAATQALRAIESTPSVAAHHNLIGVIRQKQGALQVAAACFQRALEIDPRFALARTNAGSCHLLSGRLGEAIAAYRLALELEPASSSANSNLLFALNYDPDRSAEQIFEAYQEFDRSVGLPLKAFRSCHENLPIEGRRLRIGYVSPDFRQHAVMRFLEPVLAHHDKLQVDVYAYSEVLREDVVTERARTYVTAWRNTAGQSDEAVAAMIRDDRIDVLIDVAGHTAGNRLRVFARQPAPVSVSWMGYGYTTGLSAIDYFLTDAICAPAGSDGLFAERLWRMARTCYVYRPGESMGEVGELPANRCGVITFGTLTRPVRINARVVRTWARILHQVQGARLVIDSESYGDADTRLHLVAQFAAEGIEESRLRVGYHSPPWDLLREMDIALDCFPHNSGTTLFESLYMGIPFVTLSGRPSVGRLGAAILHGAGHPEWVAASEDEYVDIAVRLAQDREALAMVRAELRQEMRQSDLMDEPGFTRDIEKIYVEMFSEWERNIRPVRLDPI